MTILVTGPRGVLGSELVKIAPCAAWSTRLEDPFYQSLQLVSGAILCAGTKGFAESEGNDAAFRADVDGNIRIAKHLLGHGIFVLFVSTDAVEKVGHGTAYSRNRLLVEQFLWPQSNCAIIRPAKFDRNNAAGLAAACVKIVTDKKEGVHCWKP
jgi:dTDP-4-dehydrorhamnose reductase